MTRMEAEADALGADGIVGSGCRSSSRRSVSILPNSWRRHRRKGDHPPATGGSWRTNRDQPFTSDLSGQDFWTLIQAGYAPVGMVMGSCVYHVAHRTAWQTAGAFGTNVEMPSFTQALYDARELAMARMQAEAVSLDAEGIVGVRLDNFAHIWEGHTTEFFAIGTAVRPLRDDHTIGKPTTVLSLNDRPMTDLAASSPRRPRRAAHWPRGDRAAEPCTGRHARRRVAPADAESRTTPLARRQAGPTPGAVIGVHIHAYDQVLLLRERKSARSRRAPSTRSWRRLVPRTLDRSSVARPARAAPQPARGR